MKEDLGSWFSSDSKVLTSCPNDKEIRDWYSSAVFFITGDAMQTALRKRKIIANTLLLKTLCLLRGILIRLNFSRQIY